jgi:peroxiredoxin Q/BCP
MKNLAPVYLAMVILAGLFITPVTSYGIEVGNKAPAFIGESTHGTIRLSDFTGKKNVILALYFAIFTRV